ncbi:hypothetical protein L1049_004226 [Liquidambar formosana]|uniref:Chalcone isomerase domain-containing protein n=1 Tax=Liquidambar formosana TaxID=63359 RepID=A0AAP0RRX9_LIQFO
MVSLRFPFLFSQPSKLSNTSSHVPSRSFSATAMACTVAAAAGAGVAAGFVISQNSKNQKNPFFQNALNFIFSNFSPSNNFSPIWGSLSLADNSSPVVESKTGASFPSILNDSRRLLGIGLRKKERIGIEKHRRVYADDGDIKKLLSEKYGKLSVSELKENKEFNEDLMEGDICMTVRLQIVYGRLSIGSVRSAFEDSVGSRLQKFGGSDNKDLLQRFTSQFKDEYKIPRGSVIDLSKDRGYVLRTTIDGKEIGSIQSKLLCRSLLDLYIGEDPFDRKAKEDIEINLVSLLQK